MTGYYVLAGVSVAWALLLSAVGLTRRNFPPSPRQERALIAFGVVLAFVTIGVLVSSTKVEHPREEAAKAAEEKKAAEQPPTAAKPAGQQPPAGKATAVPVSEKEFSIAIAAGTTLKPGAYDFQVANAGKIEHDLVVQDGGQEQKTPLLKSGAKADLKVSLKPGKYRFYCSVPGHAQSGMDVKVTVG